MTKFAAETRKIQKDGDLITLKDWIANQINTSWIYSSHWQDETWVEQAKEDCLSRIDTVKKDLASLYEALSILEAIDGSNTPNHSITFR